jgi:hypothetical protein
MDARSTYHFKLVLLGNAGVGKSCLVLRFVRNEYYEDQETTIGGAHCCPLCAAAPLPAPFLLAHAAAAAACCVVTRDDCSRARGVGVALQRRS